LAYGVHPLPQFREIDPRVDTDLRDLLIEMMTRWVMVLWILSPIGHTNRVLVLIDMNQFMEIPERLRQQGVSRPGG
jgi:hypothetical protein